MSCKNYFTSLQVFFFFFIYTHYSSAQPGVKQWDFSIGGYESEFVSQLLPSPDGGFFLGGVSNSDSGYDKTADNWDITRSTYDIWIVKCNSNGIVQWDRTLGGKGNDSYYNARVTRDSGLIVVGSTNSAVSGNISTAPKGTVDMWIIKLDKNGNIQWNKRYGGSMINSASDVLELTNGYVVAGQTNSLQGGDVSNASYGDYDYWMLRIDNSGNKLWDKRYGGSLSESLSRVLPGNNKGFRLIGVSTSPISGLKTMNNYVSAHTDMWIIETDSSGNFLWDKRIGTLNDDYAVDAIKTSDGKYLLSETNSANAGGDKTVNTNGVDDFWIVKTDSMMNIIWDISIGCTSNEDDKGKLFQTYDGNYFISGTSYSDSCYWKKEINNGPENTFIVKIDTAGNKIWDKTILTGYAHNEAGLVAELTDHCIVVVNDGDGFLGGYKTDQSYNFDFWCLKLCDSTSSSIASSFNAPSNVCQEECISFTNTSSGATSYLWLFPGAAIASSTSANPSGICYNNPGTYDVTLIAFNGGNSDTMTITNAITVHAYPQPFIYTIGDTLFTQTGYAHYQWYSVNTPVGTDSPVLPVNIGTAYIVTVTDIYGCTGTSMPIDFQVGINDDNKSTWADVNYNSEEKIISCVINDAFADEKIEIIDASGKCVYKNKFHQNKTIINASNFSKGIYFVKIQSQNRQTIRKIAIN